MPHLATAEDAGVRVRLHPPGCRLSALALAAALALGWSGPSRAEGAKSSTNAPIPHAAVGFSKLLVRLDGRDEIDIANLDAHVRLIERMRAKGFDAVGAENLVFGKDETPRAEYLVGGTVRELACRTEVGSLSCRVGIEWQVLDVARDEVVYEVMSRASVLDTPADQKDRMAGLLLDGAMDSLLQRSRFRKALTEHASTAPSAPFSPSTLGRCLPGRKVAESADDLLDSVVVVRERDGFGSGFLVSPDGLVLTAAHVLDGPGVKLRLRNGSELDAVAVRVSRSQDVALLRPTKPLAGRRCAAIRTELPPSGSEVYAAGAPASLELAFSLTRGIVSGDPVIEGQRRLQTDAPVSPGNSGGPIADASGAVVGLVSFKMVGARIEGVGFAVPMAEALASLGLRLGDATDPGLQSETAPSQPSPATALDKDTADGIPTIDPEGDRRVAEGRARERQAEEERAIEEDRDRRTSVLVPIMRWAGLGVSFAGLATALGTYSSYQVGRTTEAEFGQLRVWNTVGWVGVGVGAGSFALSFALRAPRRAPAAASSALQLGPGVVAWKGTF